MSLCIREELRQSRLRFQVEVAASLYCRTKKQKIALVNRWKEQYEAVYVRELLNVARNKKVAGDIIHWNLDEI